MTLSEWISNPQNWAFLVLGGLTLGAGFVVVTSRNVVHAALALVGALAATAGLFLLLSAEFVAWVLVLVYIGSVVILFLFGIMITRAPIGREAAVDHVRRWPALIAAVALFGVLASVAWAAFETTQLVGVGEGTSTDLLGESLLGRYVLPFEAVSFLLLAALIGGITLARKDTSPAEEEATARDRGLAAR
ncbi:MAG TPA: NADH-quinone oxidoreductase subunit J [Acidimicrobiia bacterium]